MAKRKPIIKPTVTNVLVTMESLHLAYEAWFEAKAKVYQKRYTLDDLRNWTALEFLTDLAKKNITFVYAPPVEVSVEKGSIDSEKGKMFADQLIKNPLFGARAAKNASGRMVRHSDFYNAYQDTPKPGIITGKDTSTKVQTAKSNLVIGPKAGAYVNPPGDKPPDYEVVKRKTKSKDPYDESVNEVFNEDEEGEAEDW